VILERPSDGLAVAPGPAQARRFSLAERRGRRRPGLAVARQLVGAQPRAERDQTGEVGDRVDGARLGDSHEAVRVEVVAQQEGGVGVRGLEQSRPPVVEQVPLVDRLQPEGVALLAQRREDGIGLTLVLRTQRGLPEPALARGFEGDRLPEARSYSQPASSFVQ
jgi:hypothetical protein